MMQRCITCLVMLLLYAGDSAAGIKDIYLLRVKGKDLLNAKKYDSASLYFAEVIKDPVYANATDYLILSCCKLHLKDTAAFRQHLIYSIEHGGADTAIIPLYFRSLDSPGHAYLTMFVKKELPQYRSIFLKKVDPLVEPIMREIAFLDQVCRKTSDKGYPSDTVSVNFRELRAISHHIDSLNYERVVDLIRHNRFPNFHNFGINAADYDPVLMHISDIGEQQWNFILNFLKQEVMSGDITPNEVVAIATRHFRSKDCTYYGSEKWGLSKPCDCEHVDKLRAEIGLDSLKDEDSRLKVKLPDCYHP